MSWQPLKLPLLFVTDGLVEAFRKRETRLHGQQVNPRQLFRPAGYNAPGRHPIGKVPTPLGTLVVNTAPECFFVQHGTPFSRVIAKPYPTAAVWTYDY